MPDSLIIHGDARHIPLGDESVQCVVTSPPYWGLRDYKIGPDQLGLEPTPDLYVQHIVDIFREVRRVLRKDGTCWVNMGDSYSGSGRGGNPDDSPWAGFMGNKEREHSAMPHLHDKVIESGAIGRNWVKPPPGLKAKDLIGSPWRVAFALQADGWWLRSDIIWSKPNPMPESVTDRPTKAHEYLFLLTKSQKYYWDQEAVREPHARPWWEESWAQLINNPTLKDNNFLKKRTASGTLAEMANMNGRNIRSVWTIATQPFPEAHFATFPEKLVEPCVLAGSKEGDVILDPFAGSGTVGVVCARLNRQFVGIELSEEYCRMALKRITPYSAQRHLPLEKM